MKKILKPATIRKASVAILVQMIAQLSAMAQVTTVCTSPTNRAYGLTSNGEIYEINSVTGGTVRTIKNNTYAGNSPSSANGIGYNSLNTRFYYFKRNVTASPQEFVSFTPATNTVTMLAPSTCTDDIHTGCVSYNGLGYYTVDIRGTLHYYDIVQNKWTFITSNIVDQNGNNVTNIIKTQSAGDMAIDGVGNMWILTSSNANYGLYKFPANLPTTAVATLNVVRVISPTAVTPTGNSFAGIAFKPNGQVLMTTRSDNKLYLLQNLTTLTFIGNLSTSDAGNDLTACVFPAGVLPVTWKSFEANVQKNNSVGLTWEVAEYRNKGFYIQHSLDGHNWSDIAFVEAKNETEAYVYSYSHANNFAGKQFYRIRQVDLDERSSFSEIASVTLRNENCAATVWPNPAQDKLRVYTSLTENTDSRVTIVDLAGRKFLESRLQTNTTTIDISRLPPGMYIVRVQNDNGPHLTQKIVKQ